jgi:hypothetical protein
VFSTEIIPNRSKLRKRGQALVEMYNSVYGEAGEQTSWAKLETAPEGVRLDFSIFSPPDLDNLVEPVPENSQDELTTLRARIEDHVLRMQRGEACPLMRALQRDGAVPPPRIAQSP